MLKETSATWNDHTKMKYYNNVQERSQNDEIETDK